jgi:hypothetical protein
MNGDYETPMEEWLAVLGELWTAVGKPIDVQRMRVYQKALEDVPMGLLEKAIRRVILENDYQVVPMPGVIWAAVRKELGYPYDVNVAIEGWVEDRWNRIVVKE